MSLNTNGVEQKTPTRQREVEYTRRNAPLRIARTRRIGHRSECTRIRRIRSVVIDPNSHESGYIGIDFVLLPAPSITSHGESSALAEVNERSRCCLKRSMVALSMSPGVIPGAAPGLTPRHPSCSDHSRRLRRLRRPMTSPSGRFVLRATPTEVGGLDFAVGLFSCERSYLRMWFDVSAEVGSWMSPRLARLRLVNALPLRT